MKQKMGRRFGLCRDFDGSARSDRDGQSESRVVLATVLGAPTASQEICSKRPRLQTSKLQIVKPLHSRIENVHRYGY